ncbi:MAG: hypothetical protein CBD18_00355 [Opitutales bacterium TMED158]|nr:MAG: hypothetical protein CBD18_00355 [Opitutales bacterium TMED158]
MVGIGSEVSASSEGGNASAYRLSLVAREASAAGSHSEFEAAFKEVLNRQMIAMEGASPYIASGISERDGVSGIGTLIENLERQYNLKEVTNEQAK